VGAGSVVGAGLVVGAGFSRLGRITSAS